MPPHSLWGWWPPHWPSTITPLHRCGDQGSEELGAGWRTITQVSWLRSQPRAGMSLPGLKEGWQVLLRCVCP